MLYRSLFIVFVLALASCVNEKDYDLNSVTATPTVALPVTSGTISVLDFANDVDSTYLKTYPDGLIYFSYTKTYSSREIRGKFDLASDFASTTSFDLIPGSLPPSASETQFGSINKEIDFNFSPAQLTEMAMKGGSVNYTVSVSPATTPVLPLAVNVRMTDVVNKNTGSPLTFSTGIGSGSMPMKDFIIKMNQNRFNIQVDLVLKPRTSAVFVPVGTKVNLRLTFVNDISYIKGFFGDQVVQIPTQNSDLTVFQHALKNTKVSFVDPVLKISVANEYGAPAELNFTSFFAKKDNTFIPFQINPGNPVALASAPALGSSSKTEIAVTNATAIVTLPPNQISYTGSIRINKGLTTGANFMADTSRLKISVIAEFPLFGQISNFSLSDTLKVDLGDIQQSSVISSALRVKALNQMPLDANIQLYLTDANYKVIDSLFSPNQTYLVKSSAVTATGDLLSQGVNDQTINLLPEKVNKIFQTKYIIAKSKFNTTKDINGLPLNVKFKSTYKLKLDIGLLAKLNVTVK